MARVAVIGGGISGLSTAYYLSKAGIPSTVIEKRPRPGGVIQTERIHDCVIEGGPDSFLAAKPWAMELIRDLGLEREIIGSNDRLRKTFVWKKGKLEQIPEGLQLIVPTKVAPILSSGLFGWQTKIRMGMEWLRAPGAPRPDRSVAEFVEDHYGREALEYLAEPLLAGIYGGNPRELSVGSVLPRFVELERKYGSVTRGALASRGGGSRPLFQTLKGGLGQLVDALARSIEVTHGEAEAVERKGGRFRVRMAGEWMEADDVVLACEAHQSAALARALNPRLSELLGSVGYSSSMTLALGFDKSALGRPLEGFGFLVPKRERRRLVACTFVETKFSFRVPPGLVLLRCFFGGMGDEAVLSESDDNVVASAMDELREKVGIKGAPLFSRIFRWPRSMAQYTVGHQKRVAEMEALLGQTDGLHVAGNAFHGIGIPDCVRMGKQVAERITAVSSGSRQKG